MMRQVVRTFQIACLQRSTPAPLPERPCVYHELVPHPSQQPEDATILMAAAASGDQSAANRLLSLVYEQLRKIA